MAEEITLLDYWESLKRRKIIIVGVSSAMLLIAILYCFFTTRIYTAKATILPMGGNQEFSMASLLAQSGVGSMLLGGMNKGSSAASLVAVLESKTLSEKVVNTIDLRSALYPDHWDSQKNDWKNPKEAPNVQQLTSALQDIVKIVSDPESGLINVKVEHSNPELAASITNTYVRQLTNYLLTNALTAARRNRIFIEGQLTKAKSQLLKTGKAISGFYANNDISTAESLVNVNVASHVKAISPDDLSHKLQELSEKESTLKEKIDRLTVVKGVPQQVYLEYLTGYYKLLGEINALLTQQYEMAKINELKEDISFQVIDWAQVPLGPSKPKTTLILIITVFFAAFTSAFLAFFVEHIDRLKQVKSR